MKSFSCSRPPFQRFQPLLLPGRILGSGIIDEGVKEEKKVAEIEVGLLSLGRSKIRFSAFSSLPVLLPH